MSGRSSPSSPANLDTLVITNVNNEQELRQQLLDISIAGRKYKYDVSACLKSLLVDSRDNIVEMSVGAISELVGCKDQRMIYSQKDIIQPILNIITGDINTDKQELLKQCCRALGNLCYDCDNSRKLILESNGLPALTNLILKSIELCMRDVEVFAAKVLLNYADSDKEFTEPLLKGELKTMLKIIDIEVNKESSEDEVISSILLILGGICDSMPGLVYEEEVNKAVLNVLRETSNIIISDLCLDHLRSQAEHDSVKVLLAKEGGIELVCTRMELLKQRHQSGTINADILDVESITKMACDLIIIVLTGDEAMDILYNNGVGEVYLTMVRWLDSSYHHFLTTAALAIGNFARRDEYCTHMMDDNIFDKLLDIFDTYHGFSVRVKKEPDTKHLVDKKTLVKIEFAVLSALRNLSVPAHNKRTAAARGRAAPLLLRALPDIDEHYVAYKMLGTIRMLLDGQESVAMQLAQCPAALARVARWGLCGEAAGAAGEAPRLLAWAVRLLARGAHWQHALLVLQVEGCVSSLVYMLVASHSLMQNEAILALTLLAMETLKKPTTDSKHDDEYEKIYIEQLLKSEIGKHIAVLVDTNCAKMPVEVAENLIAFLDITTKKNKLVLDYKEAKVQDSLQKFFDSRNDLSDDLKACITSVIANISDESKAN